MFGSGDRESGEEMFSVNENARAILEREVIPNAERLRIGVTKLSNGATVLDMGIRYPGGFTAGRYFAEAGLGGMGTLSFGKMKLSEHIVPTVKIKVTAPEISEMASHVAHWVVSYGGESVVISGPVRAIRGADKFARAVSYRDGASESGVGCIQTENLPDEGLTDLIAEGAGIRPENLYILAARTGTIVGAIQVCARNVEQSLPTLFARGFPMENVVEACGVTPMVSVVDDEQIAYGRVNDCLIYGQESHIYVRCRDEEIIPMLDHIPFSKNTEIYGTQFQPLFASCGRSWANVPRDWDAPCKVNFINLTTGHLFSAGKIGYHTLERSFLGDGGELYE